MTRMKVITLVVCAVAGMCAGATTQLATSPTTKPATQPSSKPATRAATKPTTQPAPQIITVHVMLQSGKTDVTVPMPAGWRVQKDSSGFPVVYLPPAQGNTADAQWNMEFRGNDISIKGDEVVKHIRGNLGQVKIDETGTTKTADGHEAGFVRYHQDNDASPGENRMYFIILSDKEIMWISEQAKATVWEKQAAVLAEITNGVTLTAVP